MAAGKIGACWASESWVDTAWIVNTWADGASPRAARMGSFWWWDA